jgi:ribonuclease D
VVRELWEARDAIAQKADLSPRRVLADPAIIEAARSVPAGRQDLERISGFSARQARRHASAWVTAVQRARDLEDAQLPEVTGAGAIAGPPPAHRWAERYPEAAARLAAAREVVTTLSSEHGLPAENLVSPDAIRRLSWEPPDPADESAIAAALAGYGARPWQADMLGPRIAMTWSELPPVKAEG